MSQHEGPPWVSHPKIGLPLRASDGASRWPDAVGFALIRAEDRQIGQRVYRVDVDSHAYWCVHDRPASVPPPGSVTTAHTHRKATP